LAAGVFFALFALLEFDFEEAMGMPIGCSGP